MSLYVKLVVDNVVREFKSLYFSGGEPHVELSKEALVALQRGETVLIDARVGSMHDFGILLALTSAIKHYREDITLFLPYFPGARQDRREDGFPFTAKIYADIINAQKYNAVYIMDPHSSVTPALLDFCGVIPHHVVVEEFIKGKDIAGIICPDAGAEKRTFELAQRLNLRTIAYARKHRDPRTGNLSSFSLDPLLLETNYLVADDICDGGGTFLGLAEEFRKDNLARDLHLWVTHGIFSKGTKDLFKHYKSIGCTDSFPSHSHENVEVFKLTGSNT